VQLKKVSLIQAPTPIHRLPRLSEELGLDLWIKRDDLTGFALGGNKGRKLEYLMAEALNQGAEVVVTCGSAQSNFIRQLAAACAVCGLGCVAAIMRMPYEFERPDPETGLTLSGGNLLLDHLLGADLRVYDDAEWETLYAHGENLALEYESQGKRVYRIPIGGSSPLGAYAFLQAGEEVKRQAGPFDWIVFASSSGSTQTGLSHAFHGTQTRIQGIACDPEPAMTSDLAELSGKLDALTGRPISLKPEDFHFDLRWVGPGYGVPSDEGMDALRLMARREGIFLDPIYSAKAFVGLIGLANEGSVAGRVLFWHTGGTPALFALPPEVV
jgi:D-cysteine desulfhydrase family pyridoxal phosphate-dependent enzyme